MNYIIIDHEPEIIQHSHRPPSAKFNFKEMSHDDAVRLCEFLGIARQVVLCFKRMENAG